MKKRYMVAAPHLHASMFFDDAAAAFIKAIDFNPQQHGDKLQRHVGFVERGTIEDYTSSFKALAKVFTGIRLQDITPAQFRDYQEKRASGALTNQDHRPANMQGPGVNPNTINKELGLLLRVLRISKAWSAEIAESYIPLNPQESNMQRAMTPQEQEHFLQVAASQERWSTVYWYSVLALRTTMSTNELRNLRVRDINTSEGIIRIGTDGAKNKYRIRTIPLDSEGIKASLFLLQRAKRLGATAPDHFVFPFRIIRNEFDPSRAMTESGIRHPWGEVRAAADLPWLRQYDLRHSAITRLAEAGTPIQVIMDMAGHVSQRMSAHYTHISMQAKRRAVDLSSLTQAEAVSKKTRGNGKGLAYAIAEKADVGIGNVGKLIKRLQRAGLSPDVILGILADEGEA
jgi:integrase